MIYSDRYKIIFGWYCCLFLTFVCQKQLNACEEIIKRATPPCELAQKLEQFFHNEDIQKAFLCKENLMPNAQRREVARKYQLEKLAWFNYVFRTPLIPGYVLKLGPIHWMNSFGGEAVRDNAVRTKNVSRVAYQQLVEDVISKKQLQHVHVVKKYLWRVAGKSELNDHNYVVVAEDIKERLLSFEENLERFKKMSGEELSELQTIAQDAYIADLTLYNCIFGHDGYLYIIDTEQSHKAHEEDFFLQNLEHMTEDTQTGLRHIERMKKVLQPYYYERLIASNNLAWQGVEMGIERDDQPTVTKEYSDLTDLVIKSY